jgi:topoisomerase-4 subunit A
VEIRKEHDALTEEKAGLEALLASDDAAVDRLPAWERGNVRQTFSKETALGARRTQFADAPDIDLDLEQALIEKEPITVVMLRKGLDPWHEGSPSWPVAAAVQGRRQGRLVFHAEHHQTRFIVAHRRARPSRWASTSCPAGVGMASRSA